VHESRPEIRPAPLALAPPLLPPVGARRMGGTAYTSYSIGRKLSSYLEQPTDAPYRSFATVRRLLAAYRRTLGPTRFIAVRKS
jgi:hypothetical protein